MRMIMMLAAGATAIALPGYQATAAGEKSAALHAALNGASEVPGPGDPDASGTATVTIAPGGTSVCYTIEGVTGLGAVAAAHIHRGAAGVAGPPVVMLDPPVDGHVKGCAKVDAAMAAEIQRNPASFYVNLHNPEFPAGAIRGQLHD